MWKESGPLNTDILFIDKAAMRSSVEGYLTCGAGILQLVIFWLQATIWSVLQTLKGEKESSLLGPRKTKLINVSPQVKTLL